MLQFFDDLPSDRWAAFLYVEQHARQNFLSEPSSTEGRLQYVQMTLIAAYELKLRILPEWQSEAALLYSLTSICSENGGRSFERDLAALMPKIKSLAKRGTALRPAKVPLYLSKE